MTDQPLNPAASVLPDQPELELRERMVILERRIGIVAACALCAELGVVAIALLLAVNTWKARKT